MRKNKATKSGKDFFNKILKDPTTRMLFEEEKSKSASFVKKQMSEYRSILKKVANNTATLEEATKARQIRDELGL
jgi:hypothetical protein